MPEAVRLDSQGVGGSREVTDNQVMGVGWEGDREVTDCQVAGVDREGGQVAREALGDREVRETWASVEL